jgi:hypothetical protein
MAAQTNLESQKAAMQFGSGSLFFGLIWISIWFCSMDMWKLGKISSDEI